MADIFTKKKRSEVMSLIRGKNTKLEIEMFRRLRRAGISFRKHYSRVIGRPDIAMPKRRVAIFIDSDFWHGWRYPGWKHKLSLQWQQKIERNRRNDRKVTRALRDGGWRVVRIWEHQMRRDLEAVLKKIDDAIRQTV